MSTWQSYALKGPKFSRSNIEFESGVLNHRAEFYKDNMFVVKQLLIEEFWVTGLVYDVLIILTM